MWTRNSILLLKIWDSAISNNLSDVGHQANQPEYQVPCSWSAPAALLKTRQNFGSKQRKIDKWITRFVRSNLKITPFVSERDIPWVFRLLHLSGWILHQRLSMIMQDVSCYVTRLSQNMWLHRKLRGLHQQKFGANKSANIRIFMTYNLVMPLCSHVLMLMLQSRKFDILYPTRSVRILTQPMKRRCSPLL